MSNNLDLIAALVWSLINALLWSLPLCSSIFLVPSPAPASKGRGGIGIYSLFAAFASLLLLWGFAILILALGQGIGSVSILPHLPPRTHVMSHDEWPLLIDSAFAVLPR